jgi:hypothetical protein
MATSYFTLLVAWLNTCPKHDKWFVLSMLVIYITNADTPTGGSTFGTINHGALGSWSDGPLPHGCPWGLRQANDTNPYNEKNVPNTGMTRYYEFEISNRTMSPDGVELPLLVVNGQFPGPLIEANWVCEYVYFCSISDNV